MASEIDFSVCYGHLKSSSNAISSLETVLGEWTASGRERLERRAVIPTPDRVEWFLKFEGLPIEASVLAANAIHDMRVPLDQMLTIYFRSVVRGSDARPRNIYFPARKTKEKYFAAIAQLKNKANLPSIAIDFLETTETYFGGRGEVIFLLHDLDVDSKHHALLKVEARFAKLLLQQIVSTKGILFRVGQLDGQHMFNQRPGVQGKQDLVAPKLSARPKFRDVSGKKYLEFAIKNPTQSVLLTTPDFGPNETIIFETEMEVSLSHDNLKDMGVICFLRKAHQLVTETLTSFIEETH